MHKEFLRFISQHELWKSEDKLLLAASGGIDSMVLAHLLFTSGINFSLAHVNYQLRGQDSELDEALVKETGKKFGCQVHLTRVNINKEKENIQERARELRYAYFDELCEQFGYTKIITAHHADDQLETMLLNLMRGTGIKGLGGIPLINEQIVRPLLWASKELIKAYAETEQIAFRQDKSNETGDYTRNRVRNEVLTLLENIDPNIRAKLHASRRMVKEDYFALASLARNKVRFIGQDFELHLAEAERTGWAGIIYHAFHWTGLSRTQAEEAANGETGARWVCGSWQFIRSKYHLSALALVRHEHQDKKISIGTTDVWNDYEIKINIHDSSEKPVFDPNNCNVWLRLKKTDFPLSIRNLQPDDRFKPLGLNYEVSINKYLLEKGASHAQIANTAVILTSEGKICWVPMFQVSEEFKWKLDNEQIVYLSFVPNGDEVRLSRKTIPRI